MLNLLMFTGMKGYRTYGLLGLGALMVAANALIPGAHDAFSALGVQMDPANWLADMFKMGVGVTMRSGIKIGK